MADPAEGIAVDGTIRTGVDRRLVPVDFEPVLAAAVEAAAIDHASLYVYGSVANGTVRPGSSDVDLLAIGMPSAAAAAQRLSVRFEALCRGVEIASATVSDVDADTDAAYGFRVFLRHYCVHLAGMDLAAGLPHHPADARAARGFNGDIAQHWRRWQQALDSGTVADEVLGRRVGRKTLLAVAGLVSIHDHTWTTDRVRSAERWCEVEPTEAGALHQLVRWATMVERPVRVDLRSALADGGIVSAIVDSFARDIGLWPDG